MTGDRYQEVLMVKESHESELMGKSNVVGVGVGLRKAAGQLTDEIAVVVMVSKKVDEDALDPNDRIPHLLDSVPVDVQEVGEISAQD